MTSEGDAAEPGAGYRRPPAAGRFRKGLSGNPKGRPRGRSRGSLYERVLGQMVTVRDGDSERRMRADEAFLLYMTSQALKGAGHSTRAMLDALAQVRSARGMSFDGPKRLFIDFGVPAHGDSHIAREMVRLKMAVWFWRQKVVVQLQPWIVQKALERLGDRQLTPQEQQTIVGAMKTPRRVKWPGWWEACRT